MKIVSDEAKKHRDRALEFLTDQSVLVRRLHRDWIAENGQEDFVVVGGMMMSSILRKTGEYFLGREAVKKSIKAARKHGKPMVAFFPVPKDKALPLLRDRDTPVPETHFRVVVCLYDDYSDVFTVKRL
jgi:hypothetical protein